MSRPALVALLFTSACFEWSPQVRLGTFSPDSGRVVVTPDDGGFEFDSGLKADAGPPDAGLPLEFDWVLRSIETPAALTPGDSFELSLVLQRSGPDPAPGSLIRLDLVPESEGDPRVELALAYVAAGEPGEPFLQRLFVEVPPQVVPGFYDLVALIDPDDNLTETLENNNRAERLHLPVSLVTVLPEQINFGLLGVGCTTTASIVMVNRGSSPAFVTDVVAELDPAFRFASPQLPLVLTGALALPLGYAPQGAGVHTATLAVTHDRLSEPVLIHVEGNAEVSPRRQDIYLQPQQPALDLLFVVDNSCSMVEEQGQLAADASTYIDYLEQQAIDYRIAVVTTDARSALFVGRVPVITPETPQAAQVFAENVQVGTAGAVDERGLEAVLLALSEPLVSGRNAGFLRPEASLVVIFIADEDDRSPQPPEFYAQALATLKGPEGRSRLVANGVVGPCPGVGPAPRYRAFFAETGGVAEPICSFAWNSALRTFPGPGFGYPNFFRLSRAPESAGLQVFINGQQVSEALWRFNAHANQVVFLPAAVPEPGAEVRITYRTRC